MAWTIDDSSAHYQTLIYTGDSSSTTTADRTLTNTGYSNLQPDFVGIFNRDSATNSGARWWDSTRGVGENKGLTSSGSNAEGGPNDPEFGYVNTLHSDGFGVRAGANDGNGRYTTDRGEGGGDKYVAFQWKANGGTRSTFTESGANPGGGYQANTTAGFSIVDYTGTGSAGTVSHGLGAKPEFIIVKNIDVAEDWAVYHQSNTAAPETDLLELNQTAATADAPVWNDTLPTTSVFSVGTDARVNSDAVDYIAYCWTGVQGFSQFATFFGSGGQAGPFIYTGFSPAFIIMKEYNNATGWGIWDDTRIGYNPQNSVIQPNTTSTPYTGTSYAIDFLSNGFKIRNNDGAYNGNGDYYIYGAFAKVPEVTSDGVPATAR